MYLIYVYQCTNMINALETQNVVYEPLHCHVWSMVSKRLRWAQPLRKSKRTQPKLLGDCSTSETSGCIFFHSKTFTVIFNKSGILISLQEVTPGCSRGVWTRNCTRKNCPFCIRKHRRAGRNHQHITQMQRDMTYSLWFPSTTFAGGQTDLISSHLILSHFLPV